MSIAENKKAFHDYFIEERFEAGLVLEGWEVKAIRAGRTQLKEAYVVLKGEEVFVIGMHVSPLLSASTHIHPDATRSRKLLLHAEQISKLIGLVERAGYTLVPLNLHYTRGRIKLEIGLAKGKKQFDKRETEKERDWEREKARLMRSRV
ncbi:MULTISPECIES: SsrA-binding protein SmpB [unclassified Methyloversatilis]|jgi:SsrA-binding protein|uniref:SsrA-binding protein SmpB n=1 Tax=unclassified Methyloversatilis TaxID=2639971 RepID=UPI00083E0054|nr:MULTISPECIES: SsrA-binding protein SmpB [unclassified Methyloversatilis]OYW31104.1 MAG: SsrA-binding protein [Methyloversatilis sp. 12-65-5]AOF80955.1 SsrA-binding protein [Methyloversatilis sp. RAC08]MBL8476721.1 SsrA-binding protein SmpB [Methyloversatilis sp.]MCQ9374037.1 SsrA-binding protein SmpB [Methyloversatilis sp. XJ19-13]MCQ9378722.1 SsrA-binding protein SmpB [Methyloversatilis sp. XJ19-49]